MNAIERLLAGIAEDMKAASDSRRRSYETQGRTEREIFGITHRFAAVEKSVEADPPPLNVSILKYGFDHEGGQQ